MTVIVDPVGTPSIVYTKSGTTLIPITAPMGSAPTTPVSVPYLSGHTIALVTVSQSGASNDGGIVLPTGAEIGDRIEVMNLTGDALNINAPSGEVIGDGGGVTTQTVTKSVTYVKVNSGRWMYPNSL